ncbi:MAG TPA: neutral zinc metallopeptidase [Gaiellaceae bacterium]|nr:neutral zinc metallopeptidase [Gaiellaceae bacterium]
MKWRRGVGGRQIEDRRGSSTSGMGGLPIPIGAKGGLGGLGLIITIVVLLLSSGVLGGGGGGFNVPSLDPINQMPGAQGEGIPASEDPDRDLVEFVGFVVDDIQDSWARAFAAGGQKYEPTELVLFSGATQSGCGAASSSTGPFYCPADRKVYLDLEFFRELRDRFGAPGDFAQAYVIAHEFGHHVQNVIGVSEDVRREQQANPEQANELSVRLELQADCLAGVWAHSAFEENLLEPGDIEEGLAAAAAVGDDRIQEQATGRIDRESWTHGSSEQRTTWFRKGFDSGSSGACDTFEGDI